MSRSDGRPSQDAEFQNLQTGSTVATRRLVAGDVSSAAVVAGEVIADVGAFNTLNVENLTVTNSNALNEVNSSDVVNVPIILFTNGNESNVATAQYSGPPNKANIHVSTAPEVSDVVHWTVYVPNSGTQRRVRVHLDAALGASDPAVAPHLNVSINGGTPFLLTADNQVGTPTNYPNMYDTAPFDWTVGASMTISLSVPALPSFASSTLGVYGVVVY